MNGQRVYEWTNTLSILTIVPTTWWTDIYLTCNEVIRVATRRKIRNFVESSKQLSASEWRKFIVAYQITRDNSVNNAWTKATRNPIKHRGQEIINAHLNYFYFLILIDIYFFYLQITSRAYVTWWISLFFMRPHTHKFGRNRKQLAMNSFLFSSSSTRRLLSTNMECL